MDLAVSRHAALAGVLGGATLFGDLGGPFVSPFVDVALGAAIAAVATDSAWTLARQQRDPAASLRLFARTVRAAGVSDETPAGLFLGLARDLLTREAGVGLRLANLAGRSIRRAAQAMASRRIFAFCPGIGTAVRIAGCGQAARKAILLVGAMEAAARRLAVELTSPEGASVRTPA